MEEVLITAAAVIALLDVQRRCRALILPAPHHGAMEGATVADATLPRGVGVPRLAHRRLLDDDFTVAALRVAGTRAARYGMP